MLAVAALVCWLLTEALGALMVRGWLAAGGLHRARRERLAGSPDAMSVPVLAGHAGLNLAGLTCWICFVATGVRPLAFVALAFAAPAIGLGISTVTIWTPYPGRRPEEPEPKPASEDLGQQLIDEALSTARPPGLSLRPLLPASHGALAIATFALATLAAVSFR